MLRRLAVILAGLLLVSACGGQPAARTRHTPEPTPRATAHSPSATPTVTPTPTPTRAPKPSPSDPVDPRWHFYTLDKAWHTSPWFTGQHRVMIGYGCTVAPYYDHDPRCPGHEGFHHGIDVAMPCGTPLFSDVTGVVVDPASSGTPGPAYGVHPFRIRTDRFDVLIGHTRRVFVHPGDHVTEGQRIALSSDSGAPDGCHLHFEVRRPGGGLNETVDPAALLKLS